LFSGISDDLLGLVEFCNPTKTYGEIILAVQCYNGVLPRRNQ